MKIKFKINNNYKCFMLLPNINFWYAEDSIFFGWLCWGFNIDYEYGKE